MHEVVRRLSSSWKSQNVWNEARPVTQVEIQLCVSTQMWPDSLGSLVQKLPHATGTRQSFQLCKFKSIGGEALDFDCKILSSSCDGNSYCVVGLNHHSCALQY